MGLIRFLFAISVILEHVPSVFGIHFLNGKIAVQSFFIVSGFYMALILNEKYKESYYLFISNRFLRIFPIYWIVLLGTFLFLGFEKSFIHLFLENFGGKQGSVFISFQFIQKNMFLATTPDYFIYIKNIYDNLLVGQAWTLGIEVTFYLLAPFIARRSLIFLFPLFIISIIVRLLLTHGIHFYQVFTEDYYFMPNLIFFVLGILSYKLYVYIKHKNLIKKQLFLFYAFLLIFMLIFDYIPIHIKGTPFLIEWVYYFILSFSIPFVFVLTKKSKYQKFLGDITYPIYICQFLVIYIVQYVGIGKNNQTLFSIVSIICILFVGILLNKYIADPIENYRQKRVAKEPIKKVE